ncbi:MAG: tyrosine-type recombinase/integrase [Anaerovoracaceae bacterium]
MEELNMFIKKNEKQSENTASNYKRSLDMFFDYFNIKTIEDVLAITKYDIAKYIDFLENKTTKTGVAISSNSVQTYFAPVQSFYNFLIKNDYLEKSPAAKEVVELPKHQTKLLDSLVRDLDNGIDEVTPFIDACTTLRQKSMVMLMLSTGMRVGELCGLTISDISDGTVRILVAKRDEIREVHVGLSVTNVIKDYIKTERVDGDYLFATSTGKQLNRININAELKAICKRCGLHKNITPHSLRRSCAGLLAVGGAQIDVIQNTLGHKSPEMTMHYIGDITSHRKSKVISIMDEVF